jgi:hypothetical protein
MIGWMPGSDSGVRTLRELSRSYLTVTKDLTRVMNRTKAIYHASRFESRVLSTN